jgi:hypothetical protein
LLAGCRLDEGNDTANAAAGRNDRVLIGADGVDNDRREALSDLNGVGLECCCGADDYYTAFGQYDARLRSKA